MLKKDLRSVIKSYFYGSNKPMLIACAGIIITIIIPIIGVFFGIILLLYALYTYIAERFSLNKNAENLYDELVKDDLKFFNKQALARLGLRREQVEIIKPIITMGPLDDYQSYVKNYNLIASVNKHGWFVTIIFFPFYVLYSGYKIITKKNIHIPQLIFKIGSDEKVRYSLCQAHVFLFSEQQLYVYRASYDICTGEFLDETTYELFYRDIDCVLTGIDYRKLLCKKKMKEFRFEFFKVISTSNTSISAYIDSPVSILDSQIKGMRTLIRNKKMEMDCLETR